jgi:hypothetical protein
MHQLVPRLYILEMTMDCTYLVIQASSILSFLKYRSIRGYIFPTAKLCSPLQHGLIRKILKSYGLYVTLRVERNALGD